MAAIVVAAAAVVASPSGSASVDDKSLTELLGWAAQLSGRALPPDGVRPVVARLSPVALIEAVCPGEADRCKNLVAAYDTAQRRIVYRDSLDMVNATDRSFIVHELVHYLQHLERGESFSTAGCRATMASEREAYRAQNRYLAQFNQLRRVGQALLFTHCDEAAADGSGLMIDASRTDVVGPQR